MTKQTMQQKHPILPGLSGKPTLKKPALDTAENPNYESESADSWQKNFTIFFNEPKAVVKEIAAAQEWIMWRKSTSKRLNQHSQEGTAIKGTAQFWRF